MGSQFATLGANVRAFINIMRSLFYHLLVTLGPTTSQRCSKLAPKPFQPWLQLYRGLNSMLNMMPICPCKCHAKGRAWCISVASMNVTGTWEESNPFDQALNAHAMIVSSVGRSLEKMVSYQQESKGRLFINNPPYRLWNWYILGTYCDLTRSLWARYLLWWISKTNLYLSVSHHKKFLNP